MNTYRDTYAVQVINRKKAGKQPRYLKGFNTRPEAEDKMNHLYSKNTYKSYPQKMWITFFHFIYNIIEIYGTINLLFDYFIFT